MSIDEPTFTYDASRHDLECLTRRTDETRLQNAEANRKAREEAEMDAIQRTQIRQAQEQATREHQWEHKVPLGSAPSPVVLGSYAAARGGRTFTREEVLTVLKAHLALSTARPPEMNERDAIRALITVFERME